MVWYGMVWYGMVWYGMVWYGMVWYGMVWYGMVWYGMVWYGMVWYGMVWYGMVWYGGVYSFNISVHITDTDNSINTLHRMLKQVKGKWVPHTLLLWKPYLNVLFHTFKQYIYHQHRAPSKQSLAEWVRWQGKSLSPVSTCFCFEYNRDVTCIACKE